MLKSRASEPITLAPKRAAMRRAVERYNPKETDMSEYLATSQGQVPDPHVHTALGGSPQPIAVAGMPGQLDQLSERLSHIEEMTTRLEGFANRLAGVEAHLPKPSNGAITGDSVGHRLEAANARLAEARDRLSFLADSLEGVA